MREIGGYLQLDQYDKPMLHADGVKLNCGRNALAYILEARHITKLAVPYFLCDSVAEVCAGYGVDVSYYHIDESFTPLSVTLRDGEWLYLVNYYGQISKACLQQFSQQYGRVIMDNAQHYYADPIEGMDTLYTCRKYFGVSDGAVLYTDTLLKRELEQDVSYDRIHYVLGRFEGHAGDFFREASGNNDHFAQEPIKKMSRLTENLLHGIDYDSVKKRRTENFAYLDQNLKMINHLELRIPEGAFMYPLYVKPAEQIRHRLQEQGIYIPILWPDVLSVCEENTLEYQLAQNILPLPVDQRYGLDDMQYMLHKIMELL